jgi:hypothetical protein
LLELASAQVKQFGLFAGKWLLTTQARHKKYTETRLLRSGKVTISQQHRHSTNQQVYIAGTKMEFWFSATNLH